MKQIKFNIDGLTFVYEHNDYWLKCKYATSFYKLLHQDIINTEMASCGSDEKHLSTYTQNDAIFLYIFNERYNRGMVNYWVNSIYNTGHYETGGDFPQVHFDVPADKITTYLNKITNELHRVCNMNKQQRNDYISNVVANYNQFIVLQDF